MPIGKESEMMSQSGAFHRSQVLCVYNVLSLFKLDVKLKAGYCGLSQRAAFSDSSSWNFSYTIV